MTEKIGWHHPSDESDQWDGFNDPGIEQFRGDPILHLAREVIQNALDAAESESSIIGVDFRLHSVETETIPDVNKLKINFQECLNAAEHESIKAKVFFENAIKELNKKQVTILEISEHNTKGMKGPSQNGTPFYAFVKAKGQSKKDSDTAAGSYGIGKFAPYAVSCTRTIFVSTVYQDDAGQFIQLTQGKSILMSHDKDGQRKQGVGFWGIKGKCQPVVGISSQMPAWLQRATKEEELPLKKGTRISVLCFDAPKNWEDFLAVSVAENFFGAVSAGALKVVIGDKHLLEKTTIGAFFDNKEISALIDELKDEPDNFQNCRSFLAALSNEIEVITEESQTKELGLCQVRILLGEGLPKKVCFLRRGMLITTYLNRLKSFPDFKEFVAVFQCLSPNGNELLRAMEPPRHDNFEPDRLPTKEERRRGNRALRELASWIRDMLKRHAKDPVSEVTPLDELKDFLGDESDEATGKGTEEINPYGKIVIRAKPLKTKSEAPKTSGDNEGGGGGGGAGGGDGNGGEGGGTGGTGGGQRKAEVDLNNVRAIIASTKVRKIAFTPASSGKISLRLFEAGADTDYNVAVVKSDQGDLKNGCLVMDVVAGNRYNLSIELSEDFLGAVKVVANEI